MPFLLSRGIFIIVVDVAKSSQVSDFVPLTMGRGEQGLDFERPGLLPHYLSLQPAGYFCTLCDKWAAPSRLASHAHKRELWFSFVKRRLEQEREGHLECIRSNTTCEHVRGHTWPTDVGGGSLPW